LREIAAAAPDDEDTPDEQANDDGPAGGAAPPPGPPPVTTSPTPVPSGGTVSQPPAGLAAGSTPNDTLGKIRWLLVAALIAGAFGSLGGLALRYPPFARPKRGWN